MNDKRNHYAHKEKDRVADSWRNNGPGSGLMHTAVYLAAGALLGIMLLFPAGSLLNAKGMRMAVSVNIANVRTDAGTKFPVIWQMEKYTPVEVIARKGDWLYIKDFEGTPGWVHKSLLAQIKTVITKKNLCNVRSGPGKEYDILFKAKRGVPFRVLGKKNGWLHIKHADGEEGWIYSTLVW